MSETTTGTMPKPENDERLFDIMYSCRAMRRLKPDPVPESVLLRLVRPWAALWVLKEPQRQREVAGEVQPRLLLRQLRAGLARRQR